MGLVVVNSVIGLLPPLIIREVVDGAFKRSDGGYLDQLILAMLAVVVVSTLMGVTQGFTSQVLGQRVVYDLRRAMYRHLAAMPLQWFTSSRSGETISRINNDVGGVQGVVTDVLTGVLGNVINATVTFTVMAYIDWRLALFCVAFMPLFIYPSRRVGEVQRRIAGETQEEMAKLQSHMHETLSVSGALLTKTFGREEHEAQEFEAILKRVRRLQIRRAIVGRWFNAGLGIVAAMGPGIIYWYGGHRYIDGDATLGTVILFGVLLGRLFGPVQGLLGLNITILSSVALFERIFDYLGLENAIADRPEAIALTDPRGAVRFEHASFSYVKGKPVLHDIDIDMPAGRFVALVGHSGAGKTTTAYLVPRLYDVDSGRVTVDGHDVRDLKLATLAGAIAMVSQETYLFHDTIMENLRYGRPDATQAEVEAAARAANIHDFIAGLPAGYETITGERGYRLSGGERQRIAIARAILKDPKILILDEATSSVDSRTERAIQDALDKLTKDRTTIAIAHRLSTVLRADEIIVLDRGRIVERGTHATLLALGGEYAAIYNTQFATDGPVGDVLPLS